MAEGSAQRLPRQDWATLRQVGHWLHPCFADAEPAALPSAPAAGWPAVVALASRHMAAPALGWAWKDETRLPPDVAQAFGALFELNGERNARILAAVGTALAALNAADITPALLKGSALLADGTYFDSGLRVLLDCDMLVRDGDIDRASEILHELGFEPVQGAGLSGHHHLPMHINRALGFGIELHHAPMQDAQAMLLDTAACFDRGSSVTVGPGRAIVPHVEDRVVHNIAHAQLSDWRYRAAMPQLRQLLDIAMIRRRDDARIDWAAVAERFAKARARHVLTDNLALIEALLGQPAPALLNVDPARAEQRVRRALARGPTARAGKAIQWTLTDIVSTLSADPRVLGAWLAKLGKPGSVGATFRRRTRA